MQVLIYQPGECPRELLDAAIKREPSQNFILVPAGLAKRLGLTEHEQEPIPWAAPGGERAVPGSCCGVAEKCAKNGTNSQPAGMAAETG